MTPERISSLSSLFKHVLKCREDHGTEVWWRGHADSTWNLVPGVYRGSRNELYERNITLRFWRSAPTRHARCPARDDLSAWIQLMQHYRLPTRLLDWTQSPLVALFFAVTELPSTAGAIWALSPFALNKQSIGERMVLNTTDPRIQSLIAPAFNTVATSPPSETLATLGEEFDLRMALQLGAFTIHGAPTPLESHAEAGTCLRKIEIAPEAKSGLSEALFFLGIRRSNLFPDLENLSRELAEFEFQQ